MSGHIQAIIITFPSKITKGYYKCYSRIWSRHLCIQCFFIHKINITNTFIRGSRRDSVEPIHNVRPLFRTVTQVLSILNQMSNQGSSLCVLPFLEGVLDKKKRHHRLLDLESFICDSVHENLHGSLPNNIVNVTLKFKHIFYFAWRMITINGSYFRCTCSNMIPPTGAIRERLRQRAVNSLLMETLSLSSMSKSTLVIKRHCIYQEMFAFDWLMFSNFMFSVNYQIFIVSSYANIDRSLCLVSGTFKILKFGINRCCGHFSETWFGINF